MSNCLFAFAPTVLYQAPKKRDNKAQIKRLLDYIRLRMMVTHKEEVKLQPKPIFRVIKENNSSSSESMSVTRREMPQELQAITKKFDKDWKIQMIRG